MDLREIERLDDHLQENENNQTYDLHEKLQRLKPHINYTLNDKGLGDLFAELNKDYHRYNVTAKEWYMYTGQIWTVDIGGMKVKQRAKELADALLVYATTIENERDKQSFVNFVNRLGSLRCRETMIRDSQDRYCISQSDLDENTDLYNCQNGTLNLRTFEFYGHKPSDMLSKISNVIYNPQAVAPLWDEFLSEIMLEDIEKIAYLQCIRLFALSGYQFRSMLHSIWCINPKW